jgi:hypothetical protein
VDLAARTVTAGGETVRLQPVRFALFALLAIARAEGWPGAAGPGWLRLRDFSVGDLGAGQVNSGPALTVLETLLAATARPPVEAWVRDEMNDPEEPVAIRGSALIERINSYDGTGQNPVQSVLSQTADAIRDGMASPFLRALATPASRRMGRTAFWGLALPPERIVLRGFGPDVLGQNPKATRRAATEGAAPPAFRA